MADFLVKQIDDDACLHKTPVLTSSLPTNGRPRSSLMMQPAGKVSPLPRCPIKSDQERKRREKKEIASCRQHRT
jgi:hypothetical protein